MKYHVLLLEDVPNHGRKGDLAFVAPGFARNYLLPRGKAMMATSATINMRKKLQEERGLQAKKDRADAEALAAKIHKKSFAITVKVDPDGHMYGSVAAADISTLLFNEGFEVDKKYIALNHPIRETGNIEVRLKLPEGVEASIGLSVNPDREIKKKVVKEEKVEEAAKSEAE